MQSDNNKTLRDKENIANQGNKRKLEDEEKDEIGSNKDQNEPNTKKSKSIPRMFSVEKYEGNEDKKELKKTILDNMARVLEGSSQNCTALTFINNKILISSNNVNANAAGTELNGSWVDDVRSIIRYWCELAKQSNDTLSKDISVKRSSSNILNNRSKIFQSICITRLKSVGAGFIKLPDRVMNEIALKMLQQRDEGRKFNFKRSNYALYDPISAGAACLIADLLARDFLKVEKFIKSFPETDLVKAMRFEELPPVVTKLNKVTQSKKVFKDEFHSISSEAYNLMHNNDKYGWVLLGIGNDNLHAEDKILIYFAFTNVIFKDGQKELNLNFSQYIGISKLSCHNCALLIDAFNQSGTDLGFDNPLITHRNTHDIDFKAESSYLLKEPAQYIGYYQDSQSGQMPLFFKNLDDINKPIKAKELYIYDMEEQLHIRVRREGDTLYTRNSKTKGYTKLKKQKNLSEDTNYYVFNSETKKYIRVVIENIEWINGVDPHFYANAQLLNILKQHYDASKDMFDKEYTAMLELAIVQDKPINRKIDINPIRGMYDYSSNESSPNNTPMGSQDKILQNTEQNIALQQVDIFFLNMLESGEIKSTDYSIIVEILNNVRSNQRVQTTNRMEMDDDGARNRGQAHNAYANSSKPKYQYQGEDISMVGQQIVHKLNMNGEIFIAPVGSFNDFNERADVGNNQMEKVLRTRKALLDSDDPKIDKIAGILNLNDSHWVTYMIVRDKEAEKGIDEKRYKLYYKDPMGGVALDENFENSIKKIFSGSNDQIEINCHTTTQQTDVVNCGIYALANLEIILQARNEDLVNFDNIQFFNPTDDEIDKKEAASITEPDRMEIDQNTTVPIKLDKGKEKEEAESEQGIGKMSKEDKLKAKRQEFGDLYDAQEKLIAIQESEEKVKIEEIRSLHESEANLLREILTATKIDIRVEINITEESMQYFYRIDIPKDECFEGINLLEELFDRSGLKQIKGAKEVAFAIKPEALKANDKTMKLKAVRDVSMDSSIDKGSSSDADVLNSDNNTSSRANQSVGSSVTEGSHADRVTKRRDEQSKHLGTTQGK